MKRLIIIPFISLLLSCSNTSTMNNKTGIIEPLSFYIEGYALKFETISEERKSSLSNISSYIREKMEANEEIRLTFICTHNSRRSHMSQLWAQVASHYFEIPNLRCYSGGTEATAFNPRAVKALQRAGFSIEKTDETQNPVYNVHYAESSHPLKAFSKTFFDKYNPQEDFAAIMTCSDADQACPFVPGAESRFSIPYHDPKVADNTPEEDEIYDERCRQIATEMFFVFSNVNY